MPVLFGWCSRSAVSLCVPSQPAIVGHRRPRQRSVATRGEHDRVAGERSGHVRGLSGQPASCSDFARPGFLEVLLVQRGNKRLGLARGFFDQQRDAVEFKV
jgi:hypothetical protein